MDCTKPDVIDYSEYVYDGEPVYYRTLETVDYVKLVLVILVMVGTLFGNISVIVVVALTKSMHTTINIHVVNLAVADLLVCVTCMTAFLAAIINADHIYLLGPVMCKTSYFFQMISLTCSVLTLSAIACDRFIAIVFPLRSRFTKQRTKLVLTAIWLLSVAVSIPLLFVRKLKHFVYQDFAHATCDDSWPFAWDEEKGRCAFVRWVPQVYYTLVSTTLFFIPVTVMTVTYSFILWRMSRTIPGEHTEGNQEIQNRSRKKVIKMVFTVLLVFILCWMPTQVVTLYEKYRSVRGPLSSWFVEVARAAEFLAFSNSFLNPIIYCIFTKTFRENFLRLLCCRRRRFGMPQLMQRFRRSVTSVFTMSMTTRTTGITDSTMTHRNIEAPARRIPTSPEVCAERNGTMKEINNEENTRNAQAISRKDAAVQEADDVRDLEL